MPTSAVVFIERVALLKLSVALQIMFTFWLVYAQRTESPT